MLRRWNNFKTIPCIQPPTGLKQDGLCSHTHLKIMKKAVNIQWHGNILSFNQLKLVEIWVCTYCIINGWFTLKAELPQFNWENFPSRVVSSSAKCESGTTVTPCRPSRALQELDLFWAPIRVSVISWIIFNASKNLLTSNKIIVSTPNSYMQLHK